VLNGAFFFAAELVKRLDIECEITFVKVASYHGTASTGIVTQLIGLNEPVAGPSRGGVRGHRGHGSHGQHILER
jgi:hypoxanthine-guanine phosphoribosyltransferase